MGGELEIKDQIEAVKQTLALYSQINKDRVAIWGWSYGGYTTLRALTDESAINVDGMGGNLFQCGASVAPVTDWRLYDTCYTERYMDLPKSNPQGYDDSSLLKQKSQQISPLWW